MKKNIVLLDLFSGIGGFALGLEQAGFRIKKHFYSEIDKHAIANYRCNFKNSTYVGSITTLDGRSINHPNIITFGSPCQDFSVAGKRAGLEGQRSSLIGEAIRLIAECRPDIFIWENVKGVFSSNDGRDFWAVIQAFANIGCYRLEWQLLNTAWFLPQNRERIYLIGHLTTGKRSYPRVFPIGERDRTDDGYTERLINSNVRPVLLGQSDQTWSAKHGSIIGDNGQDAFTIRAEQSNGVCVADFRQDEGLRIREDGLSPTLQARVRLDKFGAPMVMSHYGHTDRPPQESEIVPTLKAESHGHEPMITTPMRWQRSEKGKESRKRSQKEGKDYTPFSGGNRELIPTDDPNSGCITGATNKDALIGVIQVNPSLESGGQQPYQQNRVYDDSGIAPALHSLCEKMNIANTVTPDAYLAKGERNRDENGKAVLTSMHDRRIRRLTEIECERLQGFPDDWTRYGLFEERPTRKDLRFREKNPELWAYHTKMVESDNVVLREVSKTQRYKMLGNAVTVAVVAEIGRRLLK